MGVIQGRMYDYNNARFLSVDPFIQAPTSTQSMNPYTYIFNNPLSGTDPTGYINVCDTFIACTDDQKRDPKFNRPIRTGGSTSNGISVQSPKTTTNTNEESISEKGNQKGINQQRFFNEFGRDNRSNQERVNDMFNIDSRINGTVSGIPKQHGFHFLWDELITKGLGNEIASFRDDRTNPFNGNIISEGEAFDNRFITIVTLGIGNRQKTSVRVAEGSFDIAEQRIADFLSSLGREVRPNPDEGITGFGRQADAIVDFLRVEFKSLKPGAVSNTIKNRVSDSLKNGGQSRNILFDARGSGLNQTDALHGINRTLNVNKKKVDNISVIGDDFFIGGSN